VCVCLCVDLIPLRKEFICNFGVRLQKRKRNMMMMMIIVMIVIIIQRECKSKNLALN
jgi:hypothetical protein